MLSDDVTLLLETRSGSDRAARELWARFGPRLVALAQGLLRGAGAEAGAMDTVQSVFLRLLELDPGQLARIRDVGAFLAASTRNAALNMLRATGRASRRESDHQAPGQPAPGHQAPAAHADPALLSALGALPEELREIVLLRHAAGLTFDQVAISLDVARGTVAARYRRAIELLQKQLAFSETPPDPVAAKGGAR